MKQFFSAVLLGAVMLIASLSLGAIALWASDIVCPWHNAPCYSTGQYRNVNGHSFVLYNCSCGDKYWVPQ